MTDRRRGGRGDNGGVSSSWRSSVAGVVVVVACAWRCLRGRVWLRAQTSA